MLFSNNISGIVSDYLHVCVWQNETQRRIPIVFWEFHNDQCDFGDDDQEVLFNRNVRLV